MLDISTLMPFILTRSILLNIRRILMILLKSGERSEEILMYFSVCNRIFDHISNKKKNINHRIFFYREMYISLILFFSVDILLHFVLIKPTFYASPSIQLHNYYFFGFIVFMPIIFAFLYVCYVCSFLDFFLQTSGKI